MGLCGRQQSLLFGVKICGSNTSDQFSGLEFDSTDLIGKL